MTFDKKWLINASLFIIGGVIIGVLTNYSIKRIDAWLDKKQKAQ